MGFLPAFDDTRMPQASTPPPAPPPPPMPAPTPLETAAPPPPTPPVEPEDMAPTPKRMPRKQWRWLPERVLVDSEAGGKAERCQHVGCMLEIWVVCCSPICRQPLCHLHFSGAHQSRCHEHRSMRWGRCPCFTCKHGAAGKVLPGTAQLSTSPSPAVQPAPQPQPQPGEAARSQDSRSRLLPNTIWIPGVLHLVHHIIDEYLSKLTKEVFLKKLRVLTGFFRRRLLRERFQACCCCGAFQRYRPLFHDFPAVFIDWHSEIGTFNPWGP